MTNAQYEFNILAHPRFNKTNPEIDADLLLRKYSTQAEALAACRGILFIVYTLANLWEAAMREEAEYWEDVQRILEIRKN